MKPKKHVLITGGAGFIGSHLADRLLGEGLRVTVVDNFDPFYAASVKWDNVWHNLKNRNYRLIQTDICDLDTLRERLSDNYDVIVHLAAKAGVRPSIADPVGYQKVNVLGTQNVLELAKERNVRQFVFASSSSVYGVDPHVPWREDAQVLLPISPYAGTKVSGELLGHVYSHLYGIRFLALRFFTVFGPRQRPDLAIHKMARMMLAGEPVPVYGDGSSRRDYTYIDDIITGILAAINYQGSMYEVINLGGSRAIGLLEMVRAIETVAGVKAHLDFQPEQPGDVPQTYADVHKARVLLGCEPSTDFETGLARFMEWLDAQMAPQLKVPYA
jgi:UDP-glucuronate 4-epimerase